ncbi:MAG: hypothetical protein ACKOAH_18605, partial [Pirellula sp.]
RHMLFDKPGDAGLAALITPRDDFGEIIDIGISEKSSTLGFQRNHRRWDSRGNHLPYISFVDFKS